jgi:hypothetical protein
MPWMERTDSVHNIAQSAFQVLPALSPDVASLVRRASSASEMLEALDRAAAALNRQRRLGLAQADVVSSSPTQRGVNALRAVQDLQSRARQLRLAELSAKAHDALADERRGVAQLGPELPVSSSPRSPQQMMAQQSQRLRDLRQRLQSLQEDKPAPSEKTTQELKLPVATSHVLPSPVLEVRDLEEELASTVEHKSSSARQSSPSTSAMLSLEPRSEGTPYRRHEKADPPPDRSSPLLTVGSASKKRIHTGRVQPSSSQGGSLLRELHESIDIVNSLLGPGINPTPPVSPQVQPAPRPKPASTTGEEPSAGDVAPRSDRVWTSVATSRQEAEVMMKLVRRLTHLTEPVAPASSVPLNKAVQDFRRKIDLATGRRELPLSAEVKTAAAEPRVVGERPQPTAARNNSQRVEERPQPTAARGPSPEQGDVTSVTWRVKGGTLFVEEQEWNEAPGRMPANIASLAVSRGRSAVEVFSSGRTRSLSRSRLRLLGDEESPLQSRVEPLRSREEASVGESWSREDGRFLDRLRRSSARRTPERHWEPPPSQQHVHRSVPDSVVRGIRHHTPRDVRVRVVPSSSSMVWERSVSHSQRSSPPPPRERPPPPLPSPQRLPPPTRRPPPMQYSAPPTRRPTPPSQRPRAVRNHQGGQSSGRGRLLPWEETRMKRDW